MNRTLPEYHGSHSAMPDHASHSVDSSDERRWRTLNSRLQASTDSFFYGVTSTGVVCRPGCPSRIPRRKNTRFFDTLEQALRSGFRPCLRCRPEGAGPAQELADRVRSVVDEIASCIGSGRPVLLKQLAQSAGLSPFHLQRTFRAAVGITPAQYARRLRADRLAANLAASGSRTATEALYEAGFQSAGRAYSQENQLGMTHGTRKRGGPGQVIRYSCTDSPLGRMLVAATEQGVCSVAFADTDGLLLQELRTRFRAASLQEDGAALGQQVQAVLASLTGHTSAIDLPFDIRATAFQERVWRALEAIPRGQIRTYRQIAEAIGQPTATRAVARACASNPVAVLVPCHRVVGSNGALTGYRWGVERKQRLLNTERVATAAQARTP